MCAFLITPTWYSLSEMYACGKDAFIYFLFYWSITLHISYWKSLTLSLLNFQTITLTISAPYIMCSSHIYSLKISHPPVSLANPPSPHTSFFLFPVWHIFFFFWDHWVKGLNQPYEHECNITHGTLGESLCWSWWLLPQHTSLVLHRGPLHPWLKVCMLSLLQVQSSQSQLLWI